MSDNDGTKVLYITSQDYELLYRLLCDGFTVAAYINGEMEGRKALCTIVRTGQSDIKAYGRGITYFSVHPWMHEDWCNPHKLDEAGMFIMDCKINNVEFIVGINQDAIKLPSTKTNAAD